MKAFVSGMLLLSGMIFALPHGASAQPFSNADVDGCYTSSLNGTNIDPVTMQQFPTATLARVCVDGNGTVTWFSAFQNIGGCFLVGLRSSDDPSTYNLNAGGSGPAIVNAEVFSVTDQCGGAVDLPIVVGEKVQLRARLMLDGNENLHVLVTTFLLLENPTVPAVPTVGLGIGYHQ